LPPLYDTGASAMWWPASWRCVIAAIVSLLPTAAVADRTELSQQLCFSWEILDHGTCVSCPVERQAVVDGRDTCLPQGTPDDDADGDDKDEGQ
jgi:hypothetical protein